MNYWLTTHWPRRVDDAATDFEDTGVWVQDGKQSVLSDMRVGDFLLIYESGSGRTAVENLADGSQHTVARRKGRQGVVALAEITSVPVEIEDSQREEYTDGSSAWWRYGAKARGINTGGFLGRKALAQILGYSENYAFRGFGDQKSGVRRLTQGQFEAVRSAFLEGHPSIGAILEPTKGRGIGSRTGGTGEGPEHKTLKEYIAQDPVAALGEAGLRTLEVEHLFPTADKVDLLLQDVNGRAITVEVEVVCDETELVGPLQCMKYQALLAYSLQRPVHEVRTLLAARSVAEPVKQRCRRYGIEVVEVELPIGT